MSPRGAHPQFLHRRQFPSKKVGVKLIEDTEGENTSNPSLFFTLYSLVSYRLYFLVTAQVVTVTEAPPRVSHPTPGLMHSPYTRNLPLTTATLPEHSTLTKMPMFKKKDRRRVTIVTWI